MLDFKLDFKPKYHILDFKLRLILDFIPRPLY